MSLSGWLNVLASAPRSRPASTNPASCSGSMAGRATKTPSTCSRAPPMPASSSRSRPVSPTSRSASIFETGPAHGRRGPGPRRRARARRPRARPLLHAHRLQGRRRRPDLTRAWARSSARKSAIPSSCCRTLSASVAGRTVPVSWAPVTHRSSSTTRPVASIASSPWSTRSSSTPASICCRRWKIAFYHDYQAGARRDGSPDHLQPAVTMMRSR